MAKQQITPEEREKLKRRMRRTRRKVKKIALYTFLALLVASLILFFVIKSFGVLPGWAMAIVGVLFGIILLVAAYFSLLPGIKNGAKLLQSGISVILCVLMLVGCFVLPSWKGKLEKAFVKIPTEGEMNINVYVLADSGYSEIEQMAGKTVGIQKTLDIEYQNYAIKVINKDIEGEDIRVTEVEDIYSAVEALYAGSVEAIMLNASYADIITNNDDYADFTSKTKVLYTCIQQVTLSTGANAVSNLTKETFIIAVTGVDEWDYSYISATAKPRSDVNMLLVVNPVKHQILMITIPRDSYVALYGQSGKMDKLTHATVLGMDCWIETLNNLLDIDINYYLRVNFSSVKDIVDAIGGIDVNNPYYFETGAVVTEHNNETGWDTLVYTKFPEGTIHLDGAQALGYCRERYYVKDDGYMIGDLGRNLHQSLVLKACVKKVCSVSTISKVDSLLEAVEGKFTTNLEMNDIYALVNMQLKDMADWEIVTYGLSGSNISAAGYVMGPNYELSMVELNKNTVANAQKYIQQALAGETVVID